MKTIIHSVAIRGAVVASLLVGSVVPTAAFAQTQSAARSAQIAKFFERKACRTAYLDGIHAAYEAQVRTLSGAINAYKEARQNGLDAKKQAFDTAKTKQERIAAQKAFLDSINTAFQTLKHVRIVAEDAKKAALDTAANDYNACVAPLRTP